MLSLARSAGIRRASSVGVPVQVTGRLLFRRSCSSPSPERARPHEDLTVETSAESTGPRAPPGSAKGNRRRYRPRAHPEKGGTDL